MSGSAETSSAKRVGYPPLFRFELISSCLSAFVACENPTVIHTDDATVALIKPQKFDVVNTKLLTISTDGCRNSDPPDWKPALHIFARVQSFSRSSLAGNSRRNFAGRNDRDVSIHPRRDPASSSRQRSFRAETLSRMNDLNGSVGPKRALCL